MLKQAPETRAFLERVFQHARVRFLNMRFSELATSGPIPKNLI